MAAVSRLLAGVACVCVVLLNAAPASAHAFLESSDPAANAVLPTAPQSVTLRFTEPLETSYSRARAVRSDGRRRFRARPAPIGAEPLTMTVQIPAGLGNGTYSLLWRTLSTVDGHTAQGYLPFTIGTAGRRAHRGAAGAEITTGALPEWTLAVARWLALLGLAAVAAIWPVWLFVVRPAISPAWQLGPKLTRRVRGYAAGAFAFSAAGQRRGAGRAGGGDLRSGEPAERSDDDARRYPLRHLVARARRRPA